MTTNLLHILPDLGRRHAVKIILILGVYLLFLANAIGLLNFSVHGGASVFIHASPTSPWSHPGGLLGSGEFWIFVLTGLVLSIALPVLDPIRASLLTLLAIVPPFYTSYSSPLRHLLMPLEYQLLTILMLFVVNVLMGYFEETRGRRRIMEIFGHYVPPQVVSEISGHPEHISLDGEARQMTVMFADLKGFSSVAEEMNPKQLARLLNDYFTAMTRVLYEHDATIDKYIGDSIMAFWGAPLPQSNHPQRAVHASFAMHEAMVSLVAEFRRRGWPALDMCIGINTGTMCVGNMGSEYRVSYTVVGDAVNIASRLQGLTRRYRVPTIVSEATAKAVDDVLFRELDIVQVRGKHVSTKIYQPVAAAARADAGIRQRLERHRAALALYYDNRIEEARALLAELQREMPDDPYYPAMLDYLAARVENRAVVD